MNILGQDTSTEEHVVHQACPGAPHIVLINILFVISNQIMLVFIKLKLGSYTNIDGKSAEMCNTWLLPNQTFKWRLL